MRFSVWPRSSNTYAETVELAQHAEATGWDGVWIADHFMPNQEDTSGPTGEGWMTLAALAASVPRVRLGTLVSGNTYRHPAVLAKMAAQIDIVSDGRFTLGLGSAWQENEHEAYGIDFFTVGGRLNRLEEACAVIKGLFANDYTTFEGRYYQLTNAPLAPKPVQDPLPLLIGGGGERRTMRIAAEYADHWNTWGAPDHLARKVEVLDRHCADIDRDPGEILRSANATIVLSDDPAEVERAKSGPMGARTIGGNVEQMRELMQGYVDAGIDEFIIADFNMSGLEEKKATYDRFIEEVAPAFR
jgi:F420-dependent oxidoreductase-like protein